MMFKDNYNIFRIKFDPDYGARPLKRTIQTYVQNPLSLKLLEGEFKDGDVIEVDVDTLDSLSFNKLGSLPH